ncbi:MAG: inorganic phosphate transporter family protein, partial [Candidatus Pacebacteria bacterium]|nr:inorganic phosphate transporter family protein [Candidatus Paceibacterota bacterium]
AVSCRMVPWWKAALLAAIFVVLGAWFQGRAGIETLSGLTPQDRLTAAVTVFSAATTVLLMTVARLPISTSQAVIGGIIGVGIMQGQLELSGLGKVILCWIGTPVGGMLFYVLFHHIFKYVTLWLKPSLVVQDQLLRLALILGGCYGAYALGANNVANVSAVLVGSNLLSSQWAVLLGGLGIAGGILTMSKPVMLTVGRGIVEINMFTAFIVILSASVTVHVYAMIGVPVSTSQAVVGALLGISMIKGLQVVRWRTVFHVGLAWVGTPLIAAIIAVLLYFTAHLKYHP